MFVILLTAIKATLVYPATEKHIAKYSQQEAYLVQETPEDYAKITLPYIESSTFSIQVRLCCLTFHFIQVRLTLYLTKQLQCSGTIHCLTYKVAPSKR